jgi:hypothetical protein
LIVAPLLSLGVDRVFAIPKELCSEDTAPKDEKAVIGPEIRTA